MKRTTRYIPILLLAALLSACGTTDYSTREPAPTLTVSLSATSCRLGASLTGRLTIAQRGTVETDYYALAAVVREGSVRIAVDDREIPATGEWVRLDGRNATIRITPEQAGEHELTLQAMSAAGEVSEACRLTLTAEVGTELTAQAECEAEVIDPGVDAMIPIRLAIAKAGYAGPYKVVATLAQGAGAIYHEGNVITDVEVELAAETTLYFRPAALGEQLIAFTVTAEGAQAEARAYLNVAKKIEVHCAVGEGFTVSGVGTYNTEGSDLSLSFESADGYNFEVAGWYDRAGNLLSAEKNCPIRLTLDGISSVELRLKKREVRIETTDCERIVTEYYVPSTTGNKLERQQAHDYRLRLVSDYRLSDDLVFAYDTYRYDLYPNQTVIDGRPSFIRGEAYPRFHAGEVASNWFWRCDKRFAIVLRPSDNPLENVQMVEIRLFPHETRTITVRLANRAGAGWQFEEEEIGYESAPSWESFVVAYPQAPATAHTEVLAEVTDQSGNEELFAPYSEHADHLIYPGPWEPDDKPEFDSDFKMLNRPFTYFSFGDQIELSDITVSRLYPYSNLQIDTRFDKMEIIDELANYWK